MEVLSFWRGAGSTTSHATASFWEENSTRGLFILGWVGGRLLGTRSLFGQPARIKHGAFNKLPGGLSGFNPPSGLFPDHHSLPPPEVTSTQGSGWPRGPAIGCRIAVGFRVRVLTLAYAERKVSDPGPPV
jgi:hypothetical protein